ncbi:MAG TPA: universal stress protein [Bacteroidota bacterium]|nr:universal stress protein [Bacteroidota bacterium]
MYKTILVTLDGTPSDRTIIEHVKKLAQILKSRLVLLHVADGWAARTFGADAVSPEITEDREYLASVQQEFIAAGVPADAELAYGEPADEIVKWVQKGECDLVAMTTHGHRFVADLFLGTTATRVRHSVGVPVLLLKSRGTLS